MVNQVTGEYEAQGVKMLKYLVVAKPLLREIRDVKFEQIGRELKARLDGRVIVVDFVLVQSCRIVIESIIVDPVVIVFAMSNY